MSWDSSDMLSSISPLLRHRALRVLLVAAPGLTAAVATLTAAESNLALVLILNAAAGVIISSTLFLIISRVAHRLADERIELVQSTGQEIWRVRAERFSIYNSNTGLYTDWYFRLRLQEEIERSRRYSLRFAVLLVKPLGLHQETELRTASAWFGDHVRRHLRKPDLPALLNDGSLGVMMPNTGPRAARTVQRRVAKELAAVEPRIGLACFPEDGEHAPGLLTKAADAVIEQDKTGAA